MTSQPRPIPPPATTGEAIVVPLPRRPRTSDPRAARRAFLAAALRNPGKVGAVAPTSETMAERAHAGSCRGRVRRSSSSSARVPAR